MTGLWSWLTTASHWWGPSGLLERTWEHVQYTLIALGISLLPALPTGLAIGHTGRGAGLVAGIGNVLRALPSLGVLILLAVWALDHVPIGVALQSALIVTLVLLAIPPLLTSTYAGIAAVDPAARDAAKGMGMSSWQVLVRVEVPIALPLLFSGLRSAYLQVVATATIAAALGLGGLGRFVLDGLAQQDYAQMAGGAIAVAVLAIVGDLVLAGIGRLVIPAGIRRPGRVRRRRSARTVTVGAVGQAGG